MLENKKNNKKVLPFKIKRELFYLEHFKLNVRSFDFLRLATKKSVIISGKDFFAFIDYLKRTSARQSSRIGMHRRIRSHTYVSTG